MCVCQCPWAHTHFLDTDIIFFAAVSNRSLSPWSHIQIKNVVETFAIYVFLSYTIVHLSSSLL